MLVEHTRAGSNDRNPRCCRGEPGDHALGRSRGDVLLLHDSDAHNACRSWRADADGGAAGAGRTGAPRLRPEAVA